MKNKLLFFAIFCTFFVFNFANAQNQTINFEYDAAGNCIIKYKTVVMASAPPRSNAPANSASDTTENSQSVENQNLEDMIGAIKITILPNPTKGILQINFENKASELAVNYTVMEINGRYLTGGKSADNPLILDLSGFAAGTYLLRIAVNGKTETYKIIKQ
jgi:hypothetical protein